MTRKELEALKEKAVQRRTRAEDLEKLVAQLVPLLDAVGRLLPDKVREILAKYTNQEE